MQVMIDAARDAGILLISTAGNSATNVDLVPDDFHNHVYDNVLFTAAIDSNNQLASFSSYGDVSIHLAAPGVGILSTIRSVYPALYGSSDGTSYAAPFVIGVAALLAAVNPNITYTQLKARIISATTAMPDQMNKIASGGRLNAAGVFSAPITDLLPPPYQLARLGEGKRYYLDRTYTISETPLGFDGLWWVRTRNDDKGNADENFIQIGLGHEATVYVAFGLSATELPNWLRPSADWTNTGRLLGTDVLGKTGYDTLYSRPFNPGMVTLGGPLAAGYVGPLPPDNSNYTVFIRLYTGNVDKSGVSTNRLDGYDLVFFNLAMGSSVGAANFCAACDLDGSGTIDSVDLSLFMDNFGKSM
jgi:hypothetical protein